MGRVTQKRLISAILWGALIAGTAPAVAWAQNPPPTEPKPGTRADRREDRQEYNRLEEKIRQDREKLRADIRQFGENSPQVQADRAQLRRDRETMKKLRADRRRDKQIGNRRHRRHHRRHV